MAKKERDRREVEKYRVISELSTRHKGIMRKEITIIVLLFIVVSIIIMISGLIAMTKVYECMEADTQNIAFRIAEGIAAVLLIILSVYLYARVLWKNMTDTFLKLRNDYRVVYMSGLTDESMLSDLAGFPLIRVVLFGVIFYMLVKIFVLKDMGLAYDGTEDFIVLAVMIALTMLLTKRIIKKNFSAIVGLDNMEYDISCVDGSYKFIEYMTVEENIALPYRMYRGKDSVQSNRDISLMATDIKLDYLLKIEAANLLPYDRFLAMVFRAYMIAGRDMTLDKEYVELMTGGNKARLEQVYNRMMNPYMDKGSVPTNVLK